LPFSDIGKMSTLDKLITSSSHDFLEEVIS
jgi:hypothetical protein